MPSLRSQKWSLHLSGDLGLVPEPSRTALTGAVAATAGRPRHVTMVIGWQATKADIVFVRAPWPSFRELDLARALAFHARNRRTPAQ